MPYATITGQLKDSDGTAWSNATWTAVPVSPSSKPVFPDGSPVPTTSGLLDATGHFSGQIPTTIDIRPPGTTLTITITSMTSAPPLTLTKVQIISTTAVDLGALLSPRLVAPRIKAGAIVYAYNATEVTNPVHGNGYVNTVENVSYIYMQNSWVKIGASPNFNSIRVSQPDGALTAMGLSTENTANPQGVFGAQAFNDYLGGYRFDGFSKDTSRTTTWLTMFEDATGQHIIFPNQNVVFNGNATAQGLAAKAGLTIDGSASFTAHTAQEGVGVMGFGGTTPAFTIGAPNNTCVRFVPNVDGGAYNPMVVQGDNLMFFFGATGSESGALLIGPYSAHHVGIRIDAVKRSTAVGGAFSSSAPNPIAAGTDLNAVTSIGVFTGDQTCLNMPPGLTSYVIFGLEVLQFGGPSWVQKFYPITDPAQAKTFYMRVYNGGWNPWTHYVGV